MGKTCSDGTTVVRSFAGRRGDRLDARHARVVEWIADRITFLAFVSVLAAHTVSSATAATRATPPERATSHPLITAQASGSDSAGEEAFWDALARDDAARMQTFLLRGIDTNIVHPQHGPAIVAAARERAWDVVRTLAAIVGTRIDAPNRRGETAAMLAAVRGNLDVVRLLVEKGAQLNRPGWTVLHYAAVDGNPELLQYLLDENAYIDAESPNRTTPLMMAARHENIDAVRLLIEAGADPTPRNDAGLDAAGYLESHKMTEEARWMREQARAFAQRYHGSDKAAARASDASAKPEAGAETLEPVKSGSAAVPVEKPARSSGVSPSERTRAAQSLAPAPSTAAPAAPSQDTGRRPSQAQPAGDTTPSRVRLPGMRD